MNKLNELLSKIISKLNTSVKTEAQSFTEQEKAQARANIGIVQADYFQNDPLAPDYVKNRLAYVDTKIRITWNGDTTGKFMDGDNWILISETPIKVTEKNFSRAVVTVKGKDIECPYCNIDPIDGGYTFVEFANVPDPADASGDIFGDVVMIVDYENEEGIPAGIYFWFDGNPEYYTSLFEIETGEIVHKIDPKFYDRVAWEEEYKKEIMPETLFQHGQNLYNTSFGLTNGVEYFVTFNGIEYRCMAELVNIDADFNIVIIGNLSLGGTNNGLEDNGLPFLYFEGYHPQLNMYIAAAGFRDQEAHTLSISEAVKKVHKIDPKYYDRAVWEEKEEVLPETILELSDGPTSHDYFGIEEGKVYVVSLDGVEYHCKARSFYQSFLSNDGSVIKNICIGNASLVNSKYFDSGEPFVFIDVYEHYSSYHVYSFYKIQKEQASQANIKIDELNIHKLEEKYYNSYTDIINNSPEDVLIPEMTIVIPDEEEMEFGFIPSIFPNIPNGTLVNVTINGVIYETKAKEIMLEGQYINYLGNDTIIGKETGPENFIIVLNTQMDLGVNIDLCYFFKDINTFEPLLGEVTFSVKKPAASRIREEYMPAIDYNGNSIINKPFYRTIEQVKLPQTSGITINTESFVVDGAMAHVEYDGVSYTLPTRSWPSFFTPFKTTWHLIIGDEPTEEKPTEGATPFYIVYEIIEEGGKCFYSLSTIKFQDGNQHEVSVEVEAFKFQTDNLNCLPYYVLDHDFAEQALDLNTLGLTIVEAQLYASKGLTVFTRLNGEVILVKKIDYIDFGLSYFYALSCENLEGTKHYCIQVRDKEYGALIAEFSNWSENFGSSVIKLYDLDRIENNFLDYSLTRIPDQSLNSIVKISPNTIKKMIVNSKEIDVSKLRLTTLVESGDKFEIINDGTQDLIKIGYHDYGIFFDFIGDQFYLELEYVPPILQNQLPTEIVKLEKGDVNEAIVVKTSNVDGTPTDYKTVKLGAWKEPKTIFTFDGDLTNKVTKVYDQNNILVKVSDEPIELTEENFKKLVMRTTTGTQVFDHTNWSSSLRFHFADNGMFFGNFLLSAIVFIAYADYYVSNTNQTFEKGTYFSCSNDLSSYLSYLEIGGLHKLDPEYLPEGGFGYMGSKSLAYDGISEGINFGSAKIIKVSDELIDLSKVKKIYCFSEKIGCELELPFTQEELTFSNLTGDSSYGQALLVRDSAVAAVVLKEIKINSNTTLSKGTYFYRHKINDEFTPEYISRIEYGEEPKLIDPKFISSSIPNIQTAKVGQVIAVKEINENGVPVVWETISVPTTESVVAEVLAALPTWTGGSY